MSPTDDHIDRLCRELDDAEACEVYHKGVARDAQRALDHSTEREHDARQEQERLRGELKLLGVVLDA